MSHDWAFHLTTNAYYLGNRLGHLCHHFFWYLSTLFTLPILSMIDRRKAVRKWIFEWWERERELSSQLPFTLADEFDDEQYGSTDLRTLTLLWNSSSSSLNCLVRPKLMNPFTRQRAKKRAFIFIHRSFEFVLFTTSEIASGVFVTIFFGIFRSRSRWPYFQRSRLQRLRSRSLSRWPYLLLMISVQWGKRSLKTRISATLTFFVNVSCLFFATAIFFSWVGSSLG